MRTQPFGRDILPGRIPVLSGRQPWWWAIMQGGKRIENRTWASAYRGPIFLHASKTCSRGDYENAFSWMLKTFGTAYGRTIPRAEVLPKGGIVGRARIVDIIQPDGTWTPRCSKEDEHYCHLLERRWHMKGQFGFMLADVEPVPFTPCKGMLGLFYLPEEIEKRLTDLAQHQHLVDSVP